MAPLAGRLADRLGPKLLVLVALGGFVISNVAFAAASDLVAFLGIRLLQGAAGAGLLSAALGVIGDIVAEEERARWIGVVTGSSAAGVILGPVLGGLLCDRWGFAAPFEASAVLAAIGVLSTIVLLPETRQVTELRGCNLPSGARPAEKPLNAFAPLLLLDFIAAFAIASIQPLLVLYFYDQLGFTTLQYGVVVGAFGLTTAIGQIVLPRVGSRISRAGSVAVGFLLSTVFYVGVSQATQFGILVLVGIVAGAGGALIGPALSALYLEMADERLRSEVIGVKSSAVALASVLGPLVVVVAMGVASARTIFIAAAALTILAAALSLVMLCGYESKVTYVPRAS